MNKQKISDDLKGHFERVTTETDKYFYQPGRLPSGFQGATHVTNNDLFRENKVDRAVKSLISKAAQ